MQQSRSSSPVRSSGLQNPGHRRNTFRNWRSTKDRSASEMRTPQCRSEFRRCSSQCSGRRGDYFHSSISTSSSNLNFTGDFNISFLTNSLAEFLKKVNCPFCLEEKSNKVSLIKHLDENCYKKKEKGLNSYGAFKITFSNLIKCDIGCDISLNSIEKYFFHLHSENHKRNSEAILREQLTDFLYCSCCKIFVPNNNTELNLHMKHEVHEARRKSSFRPHYFLNQGIQCIYCFYGRTLRFNCLMCPSNFLFATLSEVISHLKDFRHLMNLEKYCVKFRGIYCCFCEDTIDPHEFQKHSSSEEHVEKERRATPWLKFVFCLFCGFYCLTLNDLSAHMKTNCSEINSLRLKMTKDLKEKKTEFHRNEDKKERCILVRGDVDLVELVGFFRKFGKIISVQPDEDCDNNNNNNNNLVLEFQDKTAIDFILQTQNSIKINGKKLDIKVFRKSTKDEPEPAHPMGQ